MHSYAHASPFQLSWTPRAMFTGLHDLNCDHPPSINSRKKKDRSAGASSDRLQLPIYALNVTAKRLIESISSSHGRALIYVWAIEQDELSKRSIPTDTKPDEIQAKGQDVFVPWVLSSQTAGKANAKAQDTGDTAEQPKVFNRYYHMFARGELRQLVEEAALELGLEVGSPVDKQHQDSAIFVQGLEVIQDGWERSNCYVELRRWNASSKA